MTLDHAKNTYPFMRGGKDLMRQKKKIFGLLGVVVTTAISTIVTQWMTEREIEAKVDEVIAEKKIKNGES